MREFEVVQRLQEVAAEFRHSRLFSSLSNLLDDAAEMILKNVTPVSTADVVEVVRCRECVFYQPEYSGFGCSGAPYDFGKCTRYEFLSDEINARSHNDYCNFGEKKDGADNGKSKID